MTLTVVLKRNQENGFTAALKEFPQFLADGLDEEAALGNLITEMATYMTWKLAQELHENQGCIPSHNGVELQIF